MKILFVSDIHFFNNEDVNSFMMELGTHLQLKGFEVSIVVSSNNIKPLKDIVNGINIYSIPFSPILNDLDRSIPLLLQFHVRRLLQHLQPDIIHIQDCFLLSRAFIKVNHESAIPLIGTVHFLNSNNINCIKCINDFNELLLVTTPLETFANTLKQILNVKVLTIPNGIDLIKFSPYGDSEKIRKKYLLPTKPILLHVGEVDRESNIENIIHAVSIARKTIDFSFLIIGYKKDKIKLVELIQNLNVIDTIIFIELDDVDELATFYRMANCFITANNTVPQRKIIMQAMASGLPIIAVNNNLLIDLVHDGINGSVFENGDIDAMGLRLYEILSNAYLQEEMGKKSLKYILLNDIKNTARSYEIIYHKIFRRKQLINQA